MTRKIDELLLAFRYATKEEPLRLDDKEMSIFGDYLKRTNEATNGKRRSFYQSGGGSGKEPTIEGIVQRKGAVVSPLDGKPYSSSRKYKQHLKQNDCDIVGNDFASMASKVEEYGEGVTLIKGKTVSDNSEKDPYCYH